MSKTIYQKEKYRGKTIKVYVDKHGFFYSNFEKKPTYSYPSDAIIEAKKIINKRLK